MSPPRNVLFTKLSMLSPKQSRPRCSAAVQFRQPGPQFGYSRGSTELVQEAIQQSGGLRFVATLKHGESTVVARHSSHLARVCFWTGPTDPSAGRPFVQRREPPPGPPEDWLLVVWHSNCTDRNRSWRSPASRPGSCSAVDRFALLRSRLLAAEPGPQPGLGLAPPPQPPLLRWRHPPLHQEYWSNSR